MEKTGLDNISNIHILIALLREPRHGYELMKEIESKMGKKTSPGQVYPFIKKLSRRGLVSVKKGIRGRKTYTLTPKGRTFTKSMLTRLDAIIEASIESKIRKCANCECEVFRGWHMERGRIYCCKGCARR
ncbi:MAG: PadR family transcriptional regulator [Candidatus Aenigmarchaeota archaeon]|nr:PadR family transcriptional regulator [Candidatus Aenigmarchaeota archaeon]